MEKPNKESMGESPSLVRSRVLCAISWDCA